LRCASRSRRPKTGDIELVDEHIDDSDRAVFTDVVIDPFGEQRGLLAVLSLDKSAHRYTLPLESSILLSRQSFHTASAGFVRFQRIGACPLLSAFLPRALHNEKVTNDR
jgi:hypothetical protein